MNKLGLDNSPPSPVKQLANVYESLANDVFDVPGDIDEETTERASRIARAALDKALASDPASESVPNSASQSPSSPKTNSRPEPSADKAPKKAPKRGFFASLIDILFGTAPTKQEPQASGETTENAKRVIVRPPIEKLKKDVQRFPNVPPNSDTQPNKPPKPTKPPEPPRS